MFRKKQTPPPDIRRSVQRQPTAPVFSYYSNRLPSEPSSTDKRRSPGRAVKIPKFQYAWIKYTPTFIAGVAVVVSLVYVSTLAMSPKVQTVSVGAKLPALTQNTKVYEDGIQDILSRSVFNRSKLLIDTNKVAREIGDAFPELGEISVIIPLGSRRPVVEVQPVRSALIVSGANGAYILDSKGRAIIKTTEANSAVRDALPVVADESDLSIEKGKGVLSGEVVAFIEALTFQLAQKQIKITSMTLPATVNELHVRLEDKPYIVKLDVRGEGRLQAGTLLAVKERLEGQRITPAEYIDVRVPEKAFYR